MAMWKNDDEMFALMKEKLYTPVVGDILDQMGYKHQFLPASIRPLAAQVPTAPYILPRTSGLDWPVTPAPCWKMTYTSTRHRSPLAI